MAEHLRNMQSYMKFSDRGRYFLKETFVLLATSLLIIIIGYTHSLIELNLLIIAVTIWSIIALFWIFTKTPILFPFKYPAIFWISIYTIISVFSIDPRRSFSQMLIMLSSFFIFYFVFNLIQAGWTGDLFVKGILFSSAFFTISGLVNAGEWYYAWILSNPLKLIPSINFRPLTTNLTATFLYLAIISSITYIFFVKRRINRILLIINTILAAAMLYLTSSRGGWLAAAAGLLTLFLLLCWQRKIKLKIAIQYLRSRPIIFILISLSALLVILFTVLILYKQSVHPTHGGLLTSRKSLWEPALKTFVKNPIIGQGPFTFGSSYISSISVPPGMIYVHAHSIPMNLLAETGILGIFAMGFLVLAYIRKTLILVKSKTIKLDPLVLTSFAYIAAFLVHNLFDSLVLEPALVWPAAILLGASLGILSKEEISASKRLKFNPIIILLPLLFAWLGVMLILPYHQGVQYANQNKWQEAKQKFTLATKRDPFSAIAHQQLSLTDSVLSLQGDTNSLIESIEQLQKTIQYEPSWSLNYANLAALLAANGNFSEAQNAAIQSVSLAPKMALFQLQLGEIAEKNGDIATAATAYQQALSIENDWATSEFWSSTDFRQTIFEDWASENPIAKTVTLEEAKSIFQANNQSRWAYNQLAAAYLRAGDLGQAEKYLDNANLAYTDRPIEAIETTWLQAEILAERGNYSAAAEVGEKAINNYQAYGVYGPGTFGLLYYAPRMFRMPAMALEIVPQMVKPLTPAEWVEREKRVQYWQEK